MCAPFREPPLPSAIHTGSQSVKRRHLTDVGDQEEEEEGAVETEGWKLQGCDAITSDSIIAFALAPQSDLMKALARCHSGFPTMALSICLYVRAIP